MSIFKILSVVISIALFACNSSSSDPMNSDTRQFWQEGSYGYDLAFLKSMNIETLELIASDSNARLLLVPDWQGRVMTSTAAGLQGASHGWINHDLIRAQDWNDQFNPVGGEERFWLGPEGGPFSLYFKPGDEQIFDHWKVPDFIDLEPFQVESIEPESVVFSGSAALTNAAGNILEVSVSRQVKLISRQEISQMLEMELSDDLEVVAYQSINRVTNTSDQTWTPDYGFLSIWMLCMFNPSPEGMVLIPVDTTDRNREEILIDDYFGAVPGDRLKMIKGVVYFKVDGQLRSKIGISPAAARSWAGGYDHGQGKLTLVSYSGPEPKAPYVNSVWGEQVYPLRGDAVNAYNDGPVDGKTMGPFYEIETSSPAALLAPGDSMTHIQRVFHLRGEVAELSKVMQSKLGVQAGDVSSVF